MDNGEDTEVALKCATKRPPLQGGLASVSTPMYQLDEQLAEQMLNSLPPELRHSFEQCFDGSISKTSCSPDDDDTMKAIRLIGIGFYVHGVRMGMSQCPTPILDLSD